MKMKRIMELFTIGGFILGVCSMMVFFGWWLTTSPIIKFSVPSITVGLALVGLIVMKVGDLITCLIKPS